MVTPLPKRCPPLVGCSGLLVGADRVEVNDVARPKRDRTVRPLEVLDAHADVLKLAMPDIDNCHPMRWLREAALDDEILRREEAQPAEQGAASKAQIDEGLAPLTSGLEAQRLDAELVRVLDEGMGRILQGAPSD